MRKSRVLMAVLSFIAFSTFLIFSGCSGDKTTIGSFDDTPSYININTNNPGIKNFGVVAFLQGGIGIIDGRTRTVAGPLLVGLIGTQGGDRLDVVISPDGKTTLVSNYRDSTVFFIDTSNPATPAVKGSVDIGFFAEDIAITPNGRFALVTDGLFSPRIAVIDVLNQTLVSVYGDSKKAAEEVISTYHQAVAVARDGQTVLTADYFGGKIHSFFLSETGHLTHMCSIDVSNGGTLMPVNVAIAPDGITAIVAAVYSEPYDNKAVPIPKPVSNGMAFPVLVIPAPGVAKLVSYVKPSISQLAKPGLDLVAAQSIAFNSAGTKAYLSCAQYIERPQIYGAPAAQAASNTPSMIPLAGYQPEPELPNNVIMALDIHEPGIVCDAGTPMEVDFTNRYQLFGVDTLAMDYDTGYLWVSNMDTGPPPGSYPKNHLQVLDVNSGMVVRTISFAPLYLGDPPEEEETIPVGLYFWNH